MIRLAGLERVKLLGAEAAMRREYGLRAITISGFHDFLSGPAAARLDPRSAEAAAARKRAAFLGRVNAVIGVVLVVAAVRLARGG